jgi:hypothetical protein
MQITTIKDLKKHSGSDFFLRLNYGLKATRYILYLKDRNSFYIVSLVDSSERTLSAQEFEQSIEYKAMIEGNLYLDK